MNELADAYSFFLLNAKTLKMDDLIEDLKRFQVRLTEGRAVGKFFLFDSLPPDEKSNVISSIVRLETMFEEEMDRGKKADPGLRFLTKGFSHIRNAFIRARGLQKRLEWYEANLKRLVCDVMFLDNQMIRLQQHAHEIASVNQEFYDRYMDLRKRVEGTMALLDHDITFDKTILAENVLNTRPC